MKNPHLVSALQGMGLGLAILVGLALFISLIVRLHGETANSIKLRTVVFIILAFAIQEYWAVTIPFFLFMAALSFRAGKKAPKRGRLLSGRVNANPRSKGWIAGVLGMAATSDTSKNDITENKYGMLGDPLPGSGLQTNKYTGDPAYW